MCCSNCGPSRFSPEFTKRYKPQNHRGCSCGSGNDNKCDSESLAPVGSPLYEWEQIYGKLITTVKFIQNEWGETVQVVEKTPCPKLTERQHTRSCCSLRYKVRR